MSHIQSLFYLKLFSNAVMAVLLGAIFPYAVITTARTLRYMQGPNGRTMARMMSWWLVVIGLVFAFDSINEHLGPYSSDVFAVYLRTTGAVFTISFAACCWTFRDMFKSLLPKEDFIIEQMKRQRLLNKLQTCDELMPLPRFETRKGIVVSANRAAQNLLGYSVQDMHRMQPGQMVHPDDREAVTERVMSQGLVPYECRIVTATGRVIHVEIRSANDPNDSDLHIVFMTDNTNYVEERDRRIRDYRSAQSQKARNASTENLMLEMAKY